MISSDAGYAVNEIERETDVSPPAYDASRRMNDDVVWGKDSRLMVGQTRAKGWIFSGATRIGSG